jgi:hypothetical protein
MSTAAFTMSGSSCGSMKAILMSGRFSRILRAAGIEPGIAWPTTITLTSGSSDRPTSWAMTVSCSFMKLSG